MASWPALTLTFPADAHRIFTQSVSLSLQDRVSVALDQIEVVAIEEQSDEQWRVSFRDDATRDQAARALASLTSEGLAVAEVDVPDEDWARRSQAAIHAIRIGGVIVTPPWDTAASEPASDAVTVVIEPGMGFGSAHHATTRLCLRALQQIDPRGRTVLDIGTGSGVLAIVAARLGAISAMAVDVDPDALDSARTNAGLNQHPAGLGFRQADFRAESLPQADLVLANLTGAMLAASVDRVLRCCRPGGAAILSGITVEEAADVVAAFARHATIEWQAEEEGWIGLVVRPPV